MAFRFPVFKLSSIRAKNSSRPQSQPRVQDAARVQTSYPFCDAQCFALVAIPASSDFSKAHPDCGGMAYFSNRNAAKEIVYVCDFRSKCCCQTGYISDRMENS